jgi:hypothetical protein
MAGKGGKRSNVKPSVLFLVHVEETFRRFFPDPLYPLRLRRACTARKYDKVFVMVSGVNDDIPIPEVESVTHDTQWLSWGWGYEKECFNADEQQWVIPSTGHEWTWVPTELREMAGNLQNSKVFIGGGYHSECLQDFRDVLTHLSIPFKDIDGLIYGK